MDLNVEFVENTGLMPKAMISNVSATMRGGNPEQAALMGDFLSRIQETTPQSLKDVPDESRAIGLMMVDAQRAGMDITEAFENAQKFAFGMSDSEKDVIRQETQRVSKELGGNLQSVVNTDVEDGGFDKGILYNVPDVPPMMAAEYRNNFDRFMTLTGGNTEQAEKLAYGSVKKVWGVTETGGPKALC